MKYSGLSLLRSGNMVVGYLKNCFLVSLAIAQDSCARDKK